MLNETFSKLEYTDGKQPRRYIGNAQVGNHNYYVSEVCIKEADQYHNCAIDESNLYQCDLDNTSCEHLPFKYDGETIFDTNTVLNTATNEIDLYFDIGP